MNRNILNKLDEKQLKVEYWDKRKTLDKIAGELGCSRPTIRSWMSEYNLPCRKSGFEKGYTPWSKGKKLSPLSKERRDKLIKANKGRVAWNKGKICNLGENNPNWKGGISKFNERIRKCFLYRQWRSDVFTRDDFTCQKCGRRGMTINAHHVIPFVLIFTLNDIKTFGQAQNCEELWNINNGITLCEKCHGVNI